MQTAEYTINNNVGGEPTFHWWVSHVLERRNQIILKVKLRQKQFVKTNKKFSVEVPCNVKRARELDKKNGNTCWADVIAKETKNVQAAFDIILSGERVLNNYHCIHCHMISDIKPESSCHKARLTAGVNSTETPKGMVYTSVVPRESV